MADQQTETNAVEQVDEHGLDDDAQLLAAANIIMGSGQKSPEDDSSEGESKNQEEPKQDTQGTKSEEEPPSPEKKPEESDSELPPKTWEAFDKTMKANIDQKKEIKDQAKTIMDLQGQLKEAKDALEDFALLRKDPARWLAENIPADQRAALDRAIEEKRNAGFTPEAAKIAKENEQLREDVKKIKADADQKGVNDYIQKIRDASSGEEYELFRSLGEEAIAEAFRIADGIFEGSKVVIPPEEAAALANKKLIEREQKRLTNPGYRKALGLPPIEETKKKVTEEKPRAKPKSETVTEEWTDIKTVAKGAEPLTDFERFEQAERYLRESGDA